MNIVKYKRLGVEIPDRQTKSYDKLSFSSSLKDGFVFKDVKDFLAHASEEKLEDVLLYTKSEREKNTGLGAEIKADLIQKQNSGFYLKIDKSFAEDDYIIINYRLDEEHDVLFDLNVIELADGVKATVVINYEGGAKDGFRSGFYYTEVGTDAELNLVKVQDFSSETTNLETTKITMKERGKLHYYPIEFGSKACLTSCSTYQREEWSEVTIFPLFFVDENKRADYEQNLIVNGQNSLGVIKANGCIKDEGKKVFRGNVFLNKGCKRSIGRFSDKSVIMNRGIKAHTIPTIFCDEDDVIGEHAGSFEPLKISELYYLMSRGFDKIEARKILVKSSFLPAINLIHSAELREKLIHKLDEKLNK